MASAAAPDRRARTAPSTQELDQEADNLTMTPMPDPAEPADAADPAAEPSEMTRAADLLNEAATLLRAGTASDGVTDEQFLIRLRAIGEAAALTAQAHEITLRERDALFPDGRRRGIGPRDLAAATGVTVPRLYQILQRLGYKKRD